MNIVCLLWFLLKRINNLLITEGVETSKTNENKIQKFNFSIFFLRYKDPAKNTGFYGQILYHSKYFCLYKQILKKLAKKSSMNLINLTNLEPIHHGWGHSDFVWSSEV